MADKDLQQFPADEHYGEAAKKYITAIRVPASPAIIGLYFDLLEQVGTPPEEIAQKRHRAVHVETPTLPLTTVIFLSAGVPTPEAFQALGTDQEEFFYTDGQHAIARAIDEIAVAVKADDRREMRFSRASLADHLMDQHVLSKQQARSAAQAVEEAYLKARASALGLEYSKSIH